MNGIRISRFMSFGWSALVLGAIVSVVTLGAVPPSRASQSGSAAGPTQAVSGTSTGPEIEVKIDNFVFAPGVVTVKAGTQVTWINKDDIPHTVDSTEGKFKSAALDTDDKFQFRFSEPGEYPFYCRMHPKMTGKIIVQP
jgi:plastocyanin